MKYLLLILFVFMCACSDDVDFYAPVCEPGVYQCTDNILQYCDEGQWFDDLDCTAESQPDYEYVCEVKSEGCVHYANFI